METKCNVCDLDVGDVFFKTISNECVKYIVCDRPAFFNAKFKPVERTNKTVRYCVIFSVIKESNNQDLIGEREDHVIKINDIESTKPYTMTEE